VSKKKKQSRSKEDLFNTMFAQDDDIPEVSPGLVKKKPEQGKEDEEHATKEHEQKHEHEDKEQELSQSYETSHTQSKEQDIEHQNDNAKSKFQQEPTPKHKSELKQNDDEETIRVQYQVSPPKPTDIDNREYEWALRIKQGAKQKPTLEDIAQRRTYWIYNENLDRVDEIARHSGLDKYEVVNMAVQQLYKWMKNEQ